MSTSIPYRVGRALGRLPFIAKLLFIAVITGAVWWFATEPERRIRDEAARTEAAAQASAERVKAARVLQKEVCNAKRQDQLIDFKRMLTTDPRAAADIIRPCALALDDAELLSSVKTAEVAWYEKAINRSDASLVEKIASIDEFAKRHLVEAKQYERSRARLDAQVKKEETQRERQEQQRELASRKSKGVVIGMTEKEVLQSSWGRPESINRTTNSFRVSEQWVYGGRNYLYFQDGYLKPIGLTQSN